MKPLLDFRRFRQQNHERAHARKPRGDHRDHEQSVQGGVKQALDEEHTRDPTSHEGRGPPHDVSKHFRSARFEDAENGQHLIERHELFKRDAGRIVGITSVKGHAPDVVDHGECKNYK